MEKKYVYVVCFNKMICVAQVLHLDLEIDVALLDILHKLKDGLLLPQLYGVNELRHVLRLIL